MRKILRYLLITFAAVLGLLLLTTFVLYRASQRAPAFYQQALRVESAHHEEAGDKLEQSVLELHNNVREAGTWEAVFTEEEVNGWLAADLPSKFPNMLPRGTQEPRVAIDPEQIQVACRFDNGKFNTVVSFAVDIDLTTEVNTVAVRIGQVRAGVLPVPLKQFLDKITLAADRGSIPLSWSQVDGDPVALVTIPVQHEDYAHREIYVDTIELREGEVFLAGHTDQPPKLAGHRPDQRPENVTVHR